MAWYSGYVLYLAAGMETIKTPVMSFLSLPYNSANESECVSISYRVHQMSRGMQPSTPTCRDSH